MYQQLRAWLRGAISDLPPEIDYCETDCQRIECDAATFGRCADRLNRLAERQASPQPTPALQTPALQTPAPQTPATAPPALTPIVCEDRETAFVPVPTESTVLAPSVAKTGASVE